MSKAAFFGTLAAAALLVAAPAKAELKICNQTLNFYNLALGSVVAEGEVETEGWWTLPANSCVSLIREDLSNRYYYLYATGIYGDAAVTGPTKLCINKKAFKIERIDPVRPSCWPRGFIEAGFWEIDTGPDVPPSWIVFIEAEEGE
jgi:uncharacterized membrane protein